VCLSTGITHEACEKGLDMLSAGIGVRLLGATVIVAALWGAVAWALWVP
jgi:hypothetical protein